MSATIEAKDYTFSSLGGNLALDFSNTVGERKGAPGDEQDHLGNYGDLLRWGHQLGVLGDEQAEELALTAAAEPEKAQEVLERARELREAIYAIYAALAEGGEVAQRDLDLVNSEAALAGSFLRITRHDKQFVREWPSDGPTLDQMLWPVAWSAGELLISDEVGRVHACANDTCGWLFVDQSRNRSRQWCDMRDCGNKLKARRHYQRTREAKGSDDKTDA